MKTNIIIKSWPAWLMTTSFLCFSSVDAFGQTDIANKNDSTLAPISSSSGKESTKKLASTVNPSKNDAVTTNVNLSPVKVKGSNSDPILDSMKIDPDKDYTNTGKSRVLTTTTTFKTFRDRQIDSVEDYARRVDAAVNFNESNSSINMRGLDQNRLLTMIDGVRTTWANDGAYAGSFATQQGGLSSFDFDLLGGMDVIKSADSSFFGTGALGGVIAFRTLDPEDILKKGKNFGWMTKTTYDGSSESAYINQVFAARYKNTLFLIGGGYRNGSQTGNMGKTGGYGTSRTKSNPASYDQGDFLGKIRHYFSGGHRLGITGEWFRRNYDERTLTSQTTQYQDYHTNSKNQRSRVSVNYDYKAEDPTDLFSEGHFLAYWQNMSTNTNIRNNYTYTPSKNSWQNLDLSVQSYGVTGSATANAYTGPVHHAITFGGEAYLTDTSQKQVGAQVTYSPYLHNNYSDMPDVHGTDLGAVIQDRMSMGKNNWFHLTPSVRFDYFKRDPSNTASYRNNPGYTGLPNGAHGSHYSPKVLAEVRVAKKLTLYALYSQSFRAPSATEEYLSYSTPPFYAVTGNPNLKPETGRGWEVGMKYGDSKRGANVSFYDNYYKNYIDMMGVNSCGSAYYLCYGYTNLAKVRIYGVEANVNWAFDDHWHTWASFAYANGKNTDMNYHLASVAPFRGIIGFGYKQENWGSDLSGTFALARDNAKYLTSTGTLSNQWNTPGYVVFDWTGWYRPSFYKPLRIQAGMYNMFNKRYYNATSMPIGQTARSIQQGFYTQPGRFFKVTARIDF